MTEQATKSLLSNSQWAISWMYRPSTRDEVRRRWIRQIVLKRKINANASAHPCPAYGLSPAVTEGQPSPSLKQQSSWNGFKSKSRHFLPHKGKLWRNLPWPNSFKSPKRLNNRKCAWFSFNVLILPSNTDDESFAWYLMHAPTFLTMSMIRV